MKYCKPAPFAAVLIAGILSTSPASALTINANFNGSWSATQQASINAAINAWESVILEDESFEVTFGFSDDESYVGVWESNFSASIGSDIRPWSSGVTHTILLNEDFTFFYDDGSSPSVPTGQMDALTIVKHELGHALGYADAWYRDNFNTGNESFPWNEQIEITGNTAIFDPGGLNVEMAATDNLGHVANSGNTFNNLMTTGIGPGQRREIEPINYEMLSLAYGYNVIPEPGTMGLLAVGSFLLVARRRR